MPISVPEGQDPGSPFGAFAFHVHFSPGTGSGSMPMDGIDPAISGGFSEVTGLEATMEAKAIKEGGHNYGVHQRPGQITFATVVLKRGMMESRHLWRWWALWAGADGAQNGGWAASSRCNVTIALIHGRRPVMGWRLENAMPVKFRAGDLNARGTEVAIEELHLVHEGLHMNEVV
jgi:phage tail-like protein